MPLSPPGGLLIGHWTDPVGRTGCTAILAPDGAVAGGEVRGGGPGTREMDLLTPASGPRRIQGALFTGGSAFGLAAADGVVQWLAERGHGHPTRFGVRALRPSGEAGVPASRYAPRCSRTSHPPPPVRR